MAQEQIGRYQILRKLGKGGMGSVYKATVPVIDKVVAVKVLEPFEIMEDILGYDRLKDIFIFEARTIAGLHHSFIVDVWDYGEDDEGRPFFVMEFFCNNLGNMIAENFQVEHQSRRIHPDKVLSYGRQLLEGLAYLHHNDIVHRDIKPHNLLITDEDIVKICDFGMAMVQGISFSGPDSIQIGSPHYAAPEQSRNPNEVDARADLFSAGVLLYRMLTGELPSMRSFSLSLINPLFDRNWDDFFATALSWQPDGRFQTAEEMLIALKNLHLYWQRIPTDQLPDQPSLELENGVPVELRKESDNVCGDRARKLFGLNTLYRPDIFIANYFAAEDEGTIKDRATGLVWKRTGSEYRLPWHDAVVYIAALNKQCFAGRKTWRLPTVNELFSLYDDEKGHRRKSIFPVHEKMLWSSDRHGKRDSWYVNLDLCYADKQDVMCRNYVRAISDG